MDTAFKYQLDNLLWAIGTVIFIILGSLAIGHLARLISKWRGATASVQRRAFWGFLFASPWLIGFFIFVLGPSLASLYYSVSNYKIGDQPVWTGLDNYRQFITGEGAFGRRFQQALFNSFYYAIVGVPLQIIAALSMAVLLNQKIRGIRLFRLIFYTPVILAGGPAILLAWRYMLAANGGFVNTTLQNLAQSFFLFDWLYRGFIFAVETFNGFYSGLSRGDPIGPFKYAVPALIGVVAFYAMARGDWNVDKRERALRIAEVIGVVLGLILVANAIAPEVIDPVWAIIFSLAICAVSAVYLWQDKPGPARQMQMIGLVVLGLTLAAILVASGFAVTADTTLPYVIAIVLAALPLVAGLALKEQSQRRLVLTGASVLFGILLLGWVAPRAFADGSLSVIPQYLTMQSALVQPGDADYLADVYPYASLSVLWFYGAVVAILVAGAWLGTWHERARRYLFTGALVFFALFLAGSVLDGVRYFNAFQEISVATGSPNYHFTLFRNSAATIPDNTRVPLWMTSELWSKPALILITMWSSGAGMLIFLAALKGVPQSFYEAAEVDGANRLQKFFKITLPIISPAMFYNVVIGIIAALQTFETIYILQTPQTVDSIRSAAFFLFERTFREQNIGQGAAVSWILAVIIITLTVMQFRYSKWVHYEV